MSHTVITSLIREVNIIKVLYFNDNIPYVSSSFTDISIDKAIALLWIYLLNIYSCKQHVYLENFSHIKKKVFISYNYLISTKTTNDRRCLNLNSSKELL